MKNVFFGAVLVLVILVGVIIGITTTSQADTTENELHPQPAQVRLVENI